MESALKKKKDITAKGVSIFDELPQELYFSDQELIYLINLELKNFSVKGLANRTRSKVVKEKIASALGYPIPKSFKKTQPRFYNQNLDSYNQKSNNLQIWNEGINPNRRYLIININSDDIIVGLKIIRGEALAILDKTGTLTQKYQARLNVKESKSIVHKSDTDTLKKHISLRKVDLSKSLPCDIPTPENLLPIETLYKKLKGLIDLEIDYMGEDQERSRGWELHMKICYFLGYENFKEDGKFPDIKHQLLEVKLQTSPTIDLGLFLPNSDVKVDLQDAELDVTAKDIRYAVIHAERAGDIATIKSILLVSGENFFEVFTRFEGKVTNKKLQIPLPSDFYD